MNERGFTLIETLVVVAIIATAAFGVYALAQPSVAVAAADDGLGAAFAEARAAALTLDAATVVIAPNPDGSGFSARVYARAPGDPAFAPRNGPPSEGRDVALSETAAPLGTPGMAFAISHFGTVVGYPHFAVGATGVPSAVGCPAGGAFVLALARSAQHAQYTIPCRRAESAAVPPVVYQTPVPAGPPTAPPPVANGCPPSAACTLPTLPNPIPPVCPSGYQPDPSTPGTCDIVLATPPPTAPPTSAPSAPPMPGSTPDATVLAGYVVGIFSSDDANACGMGSIGGVFETVVIAALTDPATIGGSIPDDANDALLSGWYEHLQPCAGGITDGSAFPLTPIPNPTTLQAQLVDDLAAACAELTPTSPCNAITMTLVPQAFLQWTLLYADTPSPNGIVYGHTAYTAAYTVSGNPGIGSAGTWIVTSAASR